MADSLVFETEGESGSPEFSERDGVMDVRVSYVTALDSHKKLLDRLEKMIDVGNIEYLKSDHNGGSVSQAIQDIKDKLEAGKSNDAGKTVGEMKELVRELRDDISSRVGNHNAARPWLFRPEPYYVDDFASFADERIQALEKQVNKIKRVTKWDGDKPQVMFVDDPVMLKKVVEECEFAFRISRVAFVFTYPVTGKSFRRDGLRARFTDAQRHAFEVVDAVDRQLISEKCEQVVLIELLGRYKSIMHKRLALVSED
jgi:hypothetical protein